MKTLVGNCQFRLLRHPSSSHTYALSRALSYDVDMGLISYQLTTGWRDVKCIDRELHT